MIKKEDLTKAQRWMIADKLAEDRLPVINQKLKEVNYHESFYVKYMKRMIDIGVSLVALLVSLPINLVIAIVTYFTVGKPLFFQQERVGKNGKRFMIVKFRSMKEIYDAHGEMLPASQRITKFGKFIRKTSLDELLNFWSILKGDMSLIGPRPLVPEYEHRLNKYHACRHQVRPGLECPPRVLNGVWTWQEQFDNDVWYVENVSFITDCKMIYYLFRFALDRKSTEARANVKGKGTFMGYDLEGHAINVDGIPQEYLDLCEDGVKDEI